MPLLTIDSNVTLGGDEAQALVRAASSRVAELLGKPERYVMVKFEHNPQMLFGGGDAPLAYLELKSIGLPENRTAELSQALCDLVSSHLGVPPDRVYIEFADAARHMWGWNADTF